MTAETLPWEKGLGVVLACALLGVVLDHCYRGLPRNFRGLRRAIENQTAVLTKRQDDQGAKLDTIHGDVKQMDDRLAEALAELARRRRPPGRRNVRAKKPRP